MPDMIPLLVGEVCVDFTMPTRSTPTKMRLGGVVHAARGLWATGREYAVGAYCPAYLVEQASHFLLEHGCCEFILLGDITGAPNVVAIADVREVGHQGYEDILRDVRKVVPIEGHPTIDRFEPVVVFPGNYDLAEIVSQIKDGVKATIDAAYDVDDPTSLRQLKGKFKTIVISTSSKLFETLAKYDIAPLVDLAKAAGALHLLLKENRGGSRLFDLVSEKVEYIPAVLGTTVNSVGVGDTFTAVFGTFDAVPTEAAWRGMQVATSYSQTTFPDDFRRDVGRQLRLSLNTLQGLGGVVLPWHDRVAHPIYLAAPDFSYAAHPEIEAAVDALRYHNFVVRRPVKENGEAKPGSSPDTLRPLYLNDVQLLRDCSAVFAIPIQRDAGTLVEVGMAIEMGKPVIIFDPRNENQNTMVIIGGDVYSDDLDLCLNGLFTAVAKIREERRSE